MTIPKAVQKAADKAEALLKKRRKEQEENVEEEVVVEDEETTEDDSALEEELDTEDSDIEQDTSEAEEDDDLGQDDAPEKKEEQDGNADLKARAEKAEARAEKADARYSTLMGKYNKEVPRLSEKLADLEKRLGSKETEDARPAGRRHLSDDEVTDHGDELLDVQSRIAKGEAEDAVEPVREELSDMRKETYFTRLDTLVEDWETVNASPDFEDWLNEIDDLTGEPRQNAITRCSKSLDAKGVARIFNLFKKSNAAAEEDVPDETNAELEDQVVPDVSKRNTPAPRSAKKWSRAMIKAHYDRYQRAVRSNNPISEKRQAEFDKIDKEIARAMKSGNLIG